MATTDSAWWVHDINENKTSDAVFGVSAGLGAGKTHGAAQWHHQKVLVNQKCPFSGWMEPTYGLIRSAAIPTYKKVLTAFGYVQNKDYDVYWSPSPRIVYRRSGHEVLFISGDNPENIVAFELSHGSIDEAGATPKESLQNFRSRVRFPDSQLCQTLQVGAPQGVTGFAEEFDSDTLPDWEPIDWRLHQSTVKPWWRYILWTDDNPYLKPGYIENNIMANYGHNPNLIKSYRYGLFCPLVEGVAYSNYMPVIHDLDDIDPDPYKELYFSLDFNANPMAWVSCQKVTFVEEYGRRKHRLAVIHEATGKSSSLEDAVAEFAYKHPVLRYANTPILIYGDMSGHAKSHKRKKTDYQVIQSYLEELGYRNVEVKAARANPPETASVGAVQKMFMKNLLLLCKRCKNTKRSLQATTWKESARKLNKPTNDSWTHWTDALKYLCYSAMWDFLGSDDGQQQVYGTNRY